MLTAIFQDRLGYMAVCALAALILGGATWLLTRRLGRPDGMWWAGLVAVVTGVLAVTFMGGGAADGQCVVNRDLGEPFRTTQGLWNMAMTIPLGIFGLLAVRRPLPVLVGVVVLPLGIEFTQATVDGLGRVCDSSDAQMNILGGLVGLGLAAWLAGRRTPLDWRVGARASLIVSGLLLVVGFGVTRTVVTLTHLDGTGLSEADSAQRAAVERVVREAFGDRYELGRVQEQPCVGAPCTNILFVLRSRDEGHPEAFANGSLSWPDQRHLNVLLKDSDRPSVMGFPMKGAKEPADEREAYAVARAYANDRYPWVRGAVERKTYPVGGKAELGWMTSWRWIDRDVLMPRMLDVQVDRVGHISQVDVKLGPERLDLARPELAAADAEEAVRKALATQAPGGADDLPADLRTEAFTLKANDRKGTWRAEWLVNVWAGPERKDLTPEKQPSVSLWRVDAVSGRVYDGANMPVRH